MTHDTNVSRFETMTRFRTILADPPWDVPNRYLRNQTEHLLLGVRGKAPIRFRGQGSWLYARCRRTATSPRRPTP